MNNGFVYAFLIFGCGLFNCSDSELVENWKNPEIDAFQAQKVLVLSISNDKKNSSDFEKRLVTDLRTKGVNAFNSDDFFKNHNKNKAFTEEELEDLEALLLSQGYDAVLVSKVIGAEDKITLVQSYRNLNKTFDNFGSDYYSNQDLDNIEDQIENYVVYHAQSVLYCICPENKRQVIWRASIDVTKLDSDKKAIKEYIKMLLWTLEEQDLLISSSKF
ncbi:hypothetical protein [Nonlabens sp.]|uniref:hypothetical protein n=1 Tax=Nonlabens sp. TaxID=1888209 RepID=UPI001BD05583|nr:hypothetical protein [Nonlabens sp.]